MKKTENVVDNYFQNIIKNSWTWSRLTEEEKERFINLGAFKKIRGSKDIAAEWAFTIYESFLTGLGYDGIKWRETKK